MWALVSIPFWISGAAFLAGTARIASRSGAATGVLPTLVAATILFAVAAKVAS